MKKSAMSVRELNPHVQARGLLMPIRAFVLGPIGKDHGKRTSWSTKTAEVEVKPPPAYTKSIMLVRLFAILLVITVAARGEMEAAAQGEKGAEGPPGEAGPPGPPGPT